ncbi:MAG: ABC transporter permease [Ruminococcus sp.]|nr:ABC transporter permease [Ruminococcus sp.]
MKHKIRLWQAVLAGANAVCLTAALILTAVGSSSARSRRYDRAAEIWSGGEGGYAQISCFLAEGSGFTENSVGGVRSGLMSKLREASVTAEEGRTLVPDAYSAEVGTSQIRSSSGRSEAKITAVAGHFFLFRSFRLLSGAYLSDDLLMQDGAVIDSELAWDLFGSTDAAGMDIYIDGARFYVSGVVEAPSDKTDKKCAGKARRAYITYDGASEIYGGSESYGYPDLGEGYVSSGFDKVTCYECIVPDPVKDLAKNSVTEQFEPYKELSEIVVNSTRYSPKRLAKAFGELPSIAVRDKPIVLPFWENASRMTEVKLGAVYFARRLTLIIPVLTAAGALIWGFIVWRRNKDRLLKKAAGAVRGLMSRIRAKKQKKDNI